MNIFFDKVLNILSSKKFIFVLGFIGLYLLSTGTSWAIFSYLRKSPVKEEESLTSLEEARLKISQELAKESECPINGGMFTEVEKAIWEKRRPIAAMIENHVDS